MKTTPLLWRKTLSMLLAAVMCLGMMQAGLVGILAAPAICSHEYESSYDVAPTCTEPGIERFTCKKCTYAYTKDAPKIGHTFELAWQVDDAQKTMWHKCCRCDVTSEPHPYVAALTEPMGFTYEDGNAYLYGEWYMKAGANYYDSFSSIVDSVLDFEKESVQVLHERLQMIKDYNIPYIRFNAIGYGASAMAVYEETPSAYFAYMDYFIETAADYGIGLIPSPFWQPMDIPNYFGETSAAYSNPDSETCRFIQRFMDDYMTRYLHHPTIWGWELGNEYNLFAENPSQTMTLGEAADVRALFTNIVRELDPYRIVSSGDSVPNTFGWNYHYNNDTTAQDTYENVLELMESYVPEGMNTLSIHFYEVERGPENGKLRWYNGEGLDDVIYAWKQVADELDVALFVGEYGGHIALFTNRWVPNPPAYEYILKSAELIKVSVPEVLNACAKAGVGLNCYWGFWSEPFQGIPENVITPDSLGSFVLDYLKAYNDAWDAAVAGDLDGDGEFNNKDVTTALRKLANPDAVSCDETKMDTNGDGEFTSADAIVMMRSLAGWDNVIVKHYVQIDYVP